MLSFFTVSAEASSTRRRDKISEDALVADSLALTFKPGLFWRIGNGDLTRIPFKHALFYSHLSTERNENTTLSRSGRLPTVRGLVSRVTTTAAGRACAPRELILGFNC